MVYPTVYKVLYIPGGFLAGFLPVVGVYTIFNLEKGDENPTVLRLGPLKAEFRRPAKKTNLQSMVGAEGC